MAQFPSSFDKDDLLKCARGELFGPGNAQLLEQLGYPAFGTSSSALA